MTSAESLLRSAVDDLGEIRRIAVDDTDPVMLAVVNIGFEKGSLSILADGDDDSIVVLEGAHPFDGLEDVSDVEPWSSLIGGQPLWMWMMTNHRGYTDGLQLHVRTVNGEVIIQLLVIGSSLK